MEYLAWIVFVALSRFRWWDGYTSQNVFISNFQNKFLFCVLYRLRGGEGWPIFFHARCVILTMSVYSLVIAREYDKSIRDAQSRNEKMNLLFVVK